MRWRSLTADEVERYDVLPPELARRVRIVGVRRLPGGYAGLTLGRMVLVTRPPGTAEASRLLAHELVHVRQWTELGLVGFAARYLVDFGRGLRHQRRWDAAYRSIGLEAEARAEADRWSERRTSGRSPSAGDGGEPVP